MTPYPTLLLPAALVEPQWANATRLAGLTALPGWTALARRASVIAEAGPDGPPPSEPGHERWLRARFGLAPERSVAAWAAIADGRMHAHWRLDPVHLLVGRDHLVLTDPVSLFLAADDARGLADAIAPLFADEGLALDAGIASRWYLRELDPERPLRLRTRSMLGALGRNIDAWMPVGDDARRWRRLVNEVQMTWYAHPVNAHREHRGLPAVNSLWIEGRGPGSPSGPSAGQEDGTAATTGPSAAGAAALARIAAHRTAPPAVGTFGTGTTLDVGDTGPMGDRSGTEADRTDRGRTLADAGPTADLDRTAHERPLVVDDGAGRLILEDRLLEAHVAGDPQRWADTWRHLDATLFAPLARAEGPWRDGAGVILAGDAGWRALRVGRRADWRFWRRSPGAALLAEPRPAHDGRSGPR